MTMSVAIAIHALAAVVWVGGMFFAYMALRPAASMLPPQERLPLWRRTFAGFFVWVNLGKKYRETHPGEVEEGHALTDTLFQRLLDNKVYVAHGTAYGSESPGWFRLVFSHPLPWLEEAMIRIVRALK